MHAKNHLPVEGNLCVYHFVELTETHFNLVKERNRESVIH